MWGDPRGTKSNSSVAGLMHPTEMMEQDPRTTNSNARSRMKEACANIAVITDSCSSTSALSFKHGDTGPQETRTFGKATSARNSPTITALPLTHFLCDKSVESRLGSPVRTWIDSQPCSGPATIRRCVVIRSDLGESKRQWLVCKGGRS